MKVIKAVTETAHQCKWAEETLHIFRQMTEWNEWKTFNCYVEATFLFWI